MGSAALMNCRKKYGFWKFIGDCLMVVLTGGFWIIWIFVREMRGNVVVLGDGFVELAAAKIQIAQHIGSIPVGGLVLDDLAILCNGRLKLPLAQQFLRVAECSLSIKWHRQSRT